MLLIELHGIHTKAAKQKYGKPYNHLNFQIKWKNTLYLFFKKKLMF